MTSTTEGSGRSVEDMDNRTEVRDLLASRRARLSPERAGLTSYDFRRVPGLGRAEVAQLARVSIPDPLGRAQRPVAPVADQALPSPGGRRSASKLRRARAARRAGPDPDRIQRREGHSIGRRPGLLASSAATNLEAAPA